MPKLYFCDTGLMSWLLGIREPAQVRAHPLRGSLFENWVISEIVKAQSGGGERPRVDFWREKFPADKFVSWLVHGGDGDIQE
jgi:predicted AAA+ superfamily ATPase